MPSKEEKRRRSKLVEAIVAKDTAEAVAKMPISFADLGALFDHLDEVFGNEGCDHTLKITNSFLDSRQLIKSPIVFMASVSSSRKKKACYEHLGNVEKRPGNLLNTKKNAT